jgi:diguanylate cyclase (GGDEF)-like protein
MTAETVNSGEKPVTRSIGAQIRSWKLWSVPRVALILILAIEATTVIATVTVETSFRWHQDQFLRMLLIAGLAIVYSEITTRLDRMRRYLTSGTLVSVTGVWAVAAALSLQIEYATILIFTLLLAAGLRVRSNKVLRPHRMIFTSSTVVLATMAAGWAATSVRPDINRFPDGAATVPAVGCAVLAFLIVNWVLVVGVMYYAAGDMKIKDFLPRRDEQGLELAIVVLGVLTAQTVLHQPLLSPMILLLLSLLQRSSLVSQLEVAATTDAKTGLLNATAWQELAQRELLRAQRDQSPCAVMLLDLDHFKLVNDTHGHLAGDAALKAVADSLKKELRGYDAIARFGGEEFVVFLNDLAMDDAEQVAARTLARIRSIVIPVTEGSGGPGVVTASIGLSGYPAHGEDLTDLIEAADGALYAAKRAGRDQVSVPHFPQSVQRHA